MELKRRVDDLELQLAGRAGLSEEELQVRASWHTRYVGVRVFVQVALVGWLH